MNSLCHYKSIMNIYKDNDLCVYTCISYTQCYQRSTFCAIFFAVSEKNHTFANDYEKSRNEKSRNMENPFKFGTIVEADYFTDRVKEVVFIR